MKSPRYEVREGYPISASDLAEMQQYVYGFANMSVSGDLVLDVGPDGTRLKSLKPAKRVSEITLASTQTAWPVDDADILRVTASSGSLELQGIMPLYEGQKLELWNVGSNTFTIAHDDASAAETRYKILCDGAADLSIPQHGRAVLEYFSSEETNDGRWRALRSRGDGSGTITVAEQDGSPSYTGIGTVQVDENTDIDLTNPSAGVALLSASPPVVTATYSTAAASYSDYRARVVLLPTSATPITTLTPTNTYAQADIEGRRLLLIATGRVEIRYGDNGFDNPLARTFRWPQFATDMDGSAITWESDEFRDSMVLFTGDSVEVESYYESSVQYWRVVLPGSISVRDESTGAATATDYGAATRAIGIGTTNKPPAWGSGAPLGNGVPLYISYGEVTSCEHVRINNINPLEDDSTTASETLASLWVEGGIRSQAGGANMADLRVGASVNPYGGSTNLGFLWGISAGVEQIGILGDGVVYAGAGANETGGLALSGGNLGADFADGVFGFWKEGWAVVFGAYDTAEAASYLCYVYYNHSAAADPDSGTASFNKHRRFALWYNTSSSEFFISTGADFVSITGISQGQPVSSGNNNGMLYVDGSGNLASSANLTYASDKLTIANGGVVITTATAAPSSIPTNSIAGPFLSD